jgi:eukaryotic-like serine/threonine-protein kinase
MIMASSPKRIGKYEVLEELGRGGFATVYKARDTRLNRIVALKVLHPYRSAEPGFVERFRREAEVAANLDHPNIVAVYEADEADGQLYLAMKYVPGRTLRQILEADGSFKAEDALPILEQIAGALDYAHAQGIVHRDIKPSNIIVDNTTDGSRATVLDFGLVKALEGSTELTRAGTLLGSPEYMAPEQADPNRAHEISPATDRYALGIVAYQMLTGRVPFPGDTSATLNAHLNLKPPDPHALRAEVSPQTAAVLLKMLAKAPAERYASAREFVANLRKATTPPVIHAIPRQTSRWVWAALLGVLAVLAVGVILSLIRSQPTNQVIPTPQTTAPVLRGTATMPPTPTNRPASIDTPVATPSMPSPVLARGAGSQRLRATDGMTMVNIPAGTFKMGNETGKSDEKPVHDVTLDAFWIDLMEVTNAMFGKFVADTGYKTDAEKQGSGYVFDAAKHTWTKVQGANWQHLRGPGSSLNGRADHPVVQVSWNDANAYCKWAGGQLPTEAQWEYAARGPQSVTFPWGNDPPNDKLLNYNLNIGDTTRVGSYPRGASWVGAFDMAGNVWEWVQDWYGAYSDSSQTNPTGPVSGSNRVLRGGSWSAGEDVARMAYRGGDAPDSRSGSVGFRCVVAPGG